MDNLETVKEEPKKPSGVKKVLNVILNIFIWIFVVFAVVMTILSFAAQSNSEGVPSLFGKCILTVNTDSMSPTFNAGDLLIANRVDRDTAMNLEVGDIISFRADINHDGLADINTHRIVEVVPNQEKGVSYKTKGDNMETNPISDQDASGGIDLVHWSSVVCQYDEENGTRLAGVGKALQFIQQPTGFLVCIVLPLVLFFLYELFKFIKAIIFVKSSGKKQITAADEELIKQRAIQEFLASQKQEQTPPPPAATDETPADETPAEETPKTEEAPEEPASAKETPVEQTAVEETEAEQEANEKDEATDA